MHQIIQTMIILREKFLEEIIINAPKLIEKYNDLGSLKHLQMADKILSENYLQHADHFTRILNEQENYKKLKFAENKSTETTHEKHRK